MKLLIMGGSFDPIHWGHIGLLRAAMRQTGADRALVIPAGEPPHKDYALTASAEDRLRMSSFVDLLVPGAQVSRLEIDRRGASYTADTVREIERQYPDAELLLLIGSDMLLTFEQWREFDYLLAHTTLCAAVRNDDEYEAVIRCRRDLVARYGARIRVIELQANPVSSTDIRRRIRAGESIGELVPAVVAAYIERRGLYTEADAGPAPAPAGVVAIHKKLRNMLTDKRYIHSINVADAACRLAVRYGAPVHKAYIAGLIHDVTKNLRKSEQLHMLSRFDIILDTPPWGMKKVFHAPTATIVARLELDIYDSDILSAVRWHTTARAGMTTLDKVVYIADFISDDRDFEGVEIIRPVAYNDLDEAVLTGLRITIDEVLEKGKPIHKDTIDAYNDITYKLHLRDTD